MRLLVKFIRSIFVVKNSNILGISSIISIISHKISQGHRYGHHHSHLG